jgi:hypothetical protein
MSLASSFYTSIILFYFALFSLEEDADIDHDLLAKRLFEEDSANLL